MIGIERRSARHGLRQLLRANYAYMFLHELTFAYAFYVAYFSMQGLSGATIGAIVAMWSVSTVIFELPSGALSDRFNRRTLLMLAPLFKGACFVVWVNADGVAWLYGFGFVLWAFGGSLLSGTQEAVLYEHVHSARFGRIYEKVIGRDKAFTEAGGWLGVFLGGFIAYVDMELALLLSAVPCVLASIVAWRLTDARDSQTTGGDGVKERAAYLQNFVNAVREFRTRPRLRFLTLYLTLGVNLFWVYEEFVQLFYVAVSLPIWAFGVVGACIGAIRIVLSLNVHRFKSFPLLGVAAPFLAGLALIVAGTNTSIIMILFIAVFYAVMAPAELIAMASFQKSMGGESRATTTSAMSIVVEIFSIVFLIAFGAAIDALGVLPAFQVGGLCFLFVATWAFWQERRGLTVTGSPD